MLSAPAHACWWGTEFEDIRYIILNPNLANNRAWWTYFYTTKYYYMDAGVKGNQDELLIAAEWKQKFKLKSDIPSIENYLFGSLTQKEADTNAFYREIKSDKKLWAYFSFAKECEASMMEIDPWMDYNYDSVDVVRGSLLNKGLGLLKNEKDAFWKKKYAFQNLRLAFYEKRGDVFNFLYDAHFGFGNEKTPLDWWATHYKSMMLEHTDQDSANYMHALVFSHSSNKMLASRKWFGTKNFDGFKNLARNDGDRADLYVLKAIVTPGRALDDIKEVARFNKNHPLLPLLLIREMNKVENWIGTYTYSRNDYSHDIDNPGDAEKENVANDYYYLRAFYKQVQAMQAPDDNADIFHLIAANLALMNQDAAGAKKYLALVTSQDKAVVFQKKVLQVMLVSITQNINERQAADELGTLLQYLLDNREDQFESQKIVFSVMKFLEYHLRQKGSNHLAGLMDYIAEDKFCNSCKMNSVEYDIIDYFHRKGSTADVEKVVALFDKKDKTKLEEFLLIPYPDANYFKDLLGTLYMRQGQTRKAHDVFATIPESFWPSFDNLRYLDENPFVLKGTPEWSDWPVFYTKLQITERLLKLEESAKTNPKDLITLGHTWFNFSSYGNSWFMLDYAQSYYFEDISKGINEAALKRSTSYYLQAYSQIKDPELRAEIVYGIASAYYSAYQPTEEGYGRWADEYEKKYNNTQFYERTSCYTTRMLQDDSLRTDFFSRERYWGW